MTRNDLIPSSTTIPKSMKAAILRVGGKNIYNEPMFRLILAETHVRKASGIWNIWAKGLSVDDRGGLGISTIQKMLKEGRSTQEINEYVQERASAHPERVEVGMVNIPAYPYTGFIVEKWKPASTFGTRLDWEAVKFNGDPMAGPYPEFGEYEICAGPTPYMPTESQVEEAIRHTFRQLEDKPSTPQARMAQMEAQTLAVEEAEAKVQFNKIKDAYMEDALLMKTSSLEAGRVRQEMATRAGLTGHWGN